MIKRFTLIIVGLVLTASSIGCTPRHEAVMPDDFYIIFETIWFNPNGNPLVLLDTKNSVIGKPKNGGTECFITDFYIPQDDLQRIYDDIIAYKIKSYHGKHFVRWPVQATPKIYYRIAFRVNGLTYSILIEAPVLWSLSSNHSILGCEIGYNYDRLRMFVHNLSAYYQGTDEYQSLPEGGQWPI